MQKREDYTGRALRKKKKKRTAFAIWAEKSGVGPDHIVRKLRCSKSYAYSLLNGSATPGTKYRTWISEWTGGEVAFDAWGK